MSDHIGKVTESISNEIQLRKIRNAERAERLRRSKTSGDFLLPDRIELEYNRQKQEPIYEDLVGKFTRGEHLFRNEAKEQLLDLDREGRLASSAARVVHMHYSGDTAGLDAAIDDGLVNEAIIKSRKTVDLFKMAHKRKMDVIKLRTSIGDKEDESERIVVELEETKKVDTFDWQIEKQNRLRELKKDVSVEREILEASLAVDDLKSHPYLSSYIKVAGDDKEHKSAEESGLDSVKGWFIGKLSKDGDLINILFGQFTKDASPPVDSWIFVGHLMQKHRVMLPQTSAVAAAPETSPPSVPQIGDNAGSLSTISFSMAASVDDVDVTFGKSAVPSVGLAAPFAFDDKELGVRMRKSPLCVLPMKQIDLSFRTAKDAGGSGSLQATSSKTARAFSVTGSAFESVNGRYLQRGMFTEFPKYTNQSGWSIFRLNLVEIPELGIFADSCYDALKGPSVLELLGKKAEQAFKELVAKDCTFLEGSVQFRQRFAELSRSGTRAITTDQIMQSIRNENLKAQMRSESDEAMLVMLQALADTNASEQATSLASPMSPMSPMSPTAASIASPASPVLSPRDSGLVRTRGAATKTKGVTFISTNHDSTSEGGSTGAPYSNFERGGKLNSSATVRPSRSQTSDTFEMAKKSIPEIDSASNVHSDMAVAGLDVSTMSFVDAESESADGGKLGTKVTLGRSVAYQHSSQGFQVSRSKYFREREFELTSEVIKKIEEREALLFKLRLEAERAQRRYLDNSSSRVRDSGKLDTLFDFFKLVQQLRESTIQVSEAIGAWIRLCEKERVKKEMGKRQIAAHDSSHRDYCVAIAKRGRVIIEQSKPVLSTSIMFKRGREEAVNALDVEFVGVFKTREEAVHAFGLALSRVPSECAFIGSEDNAMAVGLRYCRKHYLVRSSKVPVDLPCEVCAAQSHSVPDSVVPLINKHGQLLPQFIWKGHSYLEKMWQDTNFLVNNIYLKFALVDYEFALNPLLLPKSSMQRSLGALASNSIPSEWAAHLLDQLKGVKELTVDAAKAGTITEVKLTGWEYMGAAFAEPVVYNLTDWKTGKLPAKTVKKKKKRGNQNETDIFSRSMPLSLVKIASAPNLLANTNPTMMRSNSFEATSSPSRLLSVSLPVSTEDGLADWQNGSELSDDRIFRSLAILGQASQLMRSKFSDDVAPKAPHKLSEATLLEIEKLRKLSKTNKKMKTSSSDLLRTLLGIGPSEEPEMKTLVETKYNFRGASLSIIQDRAPVAHRVDDIWCRTDVGEWAGLSKGRAMRSFEFQDNLLMEGRRKAAARKLLQEKMRKSIEFNYVECDVFVIQNLIQQAKTTAKVVLGLDIVLLETYLRRRDLAIKWTIKMQALYRSRVARRLFRGMKQVASIVTLRKNLTRKYSQELSVVMIPQMIAAVVRKRIRTQMKAVMWTTAHLSGVRCILSIHQISRSSKKEFVLCPTCQTKSHIKRQNVVTLEETIERSICTCRQIQDSEKWLFKVFSPFNCQVVERIFRMQELELLVLNLSSLMANRPTIPSTELNKFGTLKHIFCPPFLKANPTAQDFSNYWKSFVFAGKESCALASFPLKQSSRVVDAIKNGLSLQLPYSMRFSDSAVTVSDIDCVENTSVVSHFWEPILDYRRTMKQIEDAYTKLHDLEYRTDLAKLDLQFAYAERYERVALMLDHASMEFEESRSKVVRTQEKIDTCTEKLAAVMKFSKTMFQDFLSHELDGVEDWAQSWDALEDGSAWKGLNDKRKLEKSILKDYSNFGTRAEKLCEVQSIVASSDLRSKAAEDVLLHMTSQLSSWVHTLDELLAMSERARRDCREVFKSVVCTMSFPLKARVVPKRRLQQVPIANSTIRDPLMRTQRAYRSSWKGLLRTILPIHSNHIVAGVERPVLRSVIEIFKDPVTNYFIIQFGDGNYSDGSTEESRLHADIGLTKAAISSLTSQCLDSEIVLRPVDVARIISRTPYWPNLPPTAISPFRFNDNSLVRLERSALANQLGQTISTQVDSFNEVSPVIRDVHQWKNRKSARTPEKFSVLRVVSHNLNNPFRKLKSTYQRRQETADSEELTMAKTLASYIRLQYHTGRPCVGLEHIHRRFLHLKRNIEKSLWYQDLKLGRSTSWCNQVYKKYKTEISSQPAKSSVQIFMKSVEIRLISANKMSELQVPIHYLISRMSERPLLLMSFLLEMIMNKYSYDSMAFVFDQIDLQLPGGGPRLARWRAPFPSETPAIKFLQVRNDKFRGPAFCVHRFIAGKYFKARFMTTVSDDVKLELCKPTDGNFWAHMYDGESLSCYLSQDELRAFVANASVRSKLVTSPLICSMNLLKFEFRQELYSLLLDAIVLDPDVVQGGEALSWRDIGGYWRKEPAITDLVRTCIKDFNAWTVRSGGRIEPIADTVIAATLENVNALTNRPKWKLNFNKEKPKRRLVEVHSGIWSTVDADNYYGMNRDDLAHSQQKVQMRSPSGAPASCFSSKTVSEESALESYWAVRLLTDETKDGYHVELRPATVSENGTAQKFLAAKEIERMESEDNYSRLHRTMDSLLKRQAVLAGKICDIESHIAHKLMPEQRAALHQQTLASTFIEDRSAFIRRELNNASAACSQRMWAIFMKAFRSHCSQMSPWDSQSPCGIDMSMEDSYSAVFPLTTFAAAMICQGNRRETVTSSNTILRRAPVSAKPLMTWLDSFVQTLCSSESPEGNSEIDRFRVVFTRIKAVATKEGLQKTGRMLSVREVRKSCPEHQKYRRGIRSMIPWKRDLHRRSPATVNADNISADNNHSVRIGDRIFLILNPILGPFDIVGAKLYDPETFAVWKVTACSTHLWSSSIAPEPDLEAHQNCDEHFITKQCADRVVWTAITAGMVGAASFLATQRVRHTLEHVEEAINISQLQVDRLKVSLIHVKRITASEKPDEEELFLNPSYGQYQQSEVEHAEIVHVNKRQSLHRCLPSLSSPESKFIAGNSKQMEVYAIIIPADESVTFIAKKTNSLIWQDICLEYLADGEINRYVRTQTLSGIVFGTNRDDYEDSLPPNSRVNRWIYEYQSCLGWRKTPRDLARMSRLRTKDHKMFTEHIPTIYGDAILFLRFGSIDFEKMQSWLKEKNVEYRQLKELKRRQQEGVRLARLAHHLTFRNSVIDIANIFVGTAETMFNGAQAVRVRKAASQHPDSRATVLQCRLLFTQFSKLRRIEDKKNALNPFDETGHISCTEVLDEAFLIDKNPVETNDTLLLRFRAPPAPFNADQFLKRLECEEPIESIEKRNVASDYFQRLEQQADREVERDPTDFTARPAQVMYAMYLTHCFDCALPSNFCRFPGCSHCREEARATFLASGQSEGEQVALYGSGLHPLELAIKKFLLYSHLLFSSSLSASNGNTGGKDSEELTTSAAFEENKRTLQWRMLYDLTYRFRYLDRRAMRPELLETVSWSDIITAHSGRHAEIDESRMLDDSKTEADVLLRELEPEESDLYPDNITTETALKLKDAEIEIFSIPREIISGMLAGRRGVDCRGNRIPAKLIDPYPAKKVDEHGKVLVSIGNELQFQHHEDEVRPMSSLLCSWLMAHLALCRPQRLPDQISGDRGQLSTAAATIKFDRLHLETVTRLSCNSLVSLQFLHGVLTDSTLANDTISGCPHGAMRFCPIHLLSKVCPGLTILVFDSLSHVSVACSVDGLTLARTAAAFNLSIEDLPTIALRLNQLASKILRLTRVGSRCTSVSMDLNSVLESMSPPSKRQMAPQQSVAIGRQAGRRGVVVNRNGKRFDCAAAFLSKFE